MVARRGGAVLIALSLSTGMGRAATLYEELGARPGLEHLVDTATSIWTTDPRMPGLWDDTDMDRFERMLVYQLCQLTEGGCTYGGQTMKAAHKGLHLDTRQFNILVEDLQTAMDRLDIPFRTQNRLLALLAPMYHDVVTR